MIEVNVIEPGRIVEFCMYGDCIPDEVLQIISTQYKKFSEGIIWNFNSGSNVRLTKKEFIIIARAAKKYGIHKKTAYVGSVDLEYGILRMYEAYAEMQLPSIKMQVFRFRNDAIDWIKEHEKLT